MSKIYIEVPKTTDMATVSIPCGKDEDFLWQFTIMFEENDYLRKRIVSVLDNNCGEEDTIQSQIVANGNDRTTDFEYHIDCSDIKADVKIQVFFCKENRIIIVEW